MTFNLEDRLKIRTLFVFFLPLGFSASLVTLSHVIINSTLARSVDPVAAIASYAIAISMFGLTERIVVMLRQTCSAVVKDRLAFISMSVITFFVLLGILFIGLLIAYTPMGDWVFLKLFGIDAALLEHVLTSYRILLFVSIFSAIRCLYQGIIISNKQTKWLTIGMTIRLTVMYLLSYYFIETGYGITAQTGAVIFLCGMLIEAIISFIEGRILLKKLPKKLPDQKSHSKIFIFDFYRPLIYSACLTAIVTPFTNVMLGKTAYIELAIASYAVALSLTMLVCSFFSYIHQIVLVYYNVDKEAVHKFLYLTSLFPALFITILGYTPLGPWMLQSIMGMNEELTTASIHALRVFTILVLVFPWVDFYNGLLMLRNQTKGMIWSNSYKVIMTIITLIIGVWLVPEWNGIIGALSLSLGFTTELIVVLYLIRRSDRHLDSARRIESKTMNQ